MKNILCDETELKRDYLEMKQFLVVCWYFKHTSLKHIQSQKMTHINENTQNLINLTSPDVLWFIKYENSHKRLIIK